MLFSLYFSNGNLKYALFRRKFVFFYHAPVQINWWNQLHIGNLRLEKRKGRQKAPLKCSIQISRRNLFDWTESNISIVIDANRCAFRQSFGLLFVVRVIFSVVCPLSFSACLLARTHTRSTVSCLCRHMRSQARETFVNVWVKAASTFNKRETIISQCDSVEHVS